MTAPQPQHKQLPNPTHCRREDDLLYTATKCRQIIVMKRSAKSPAGVQNIDQNLALLQWPVHNDSPTQQYPRQRSTSK